MPTYRKKPLAQLEHGTRIYAPSAGESRFRVVSTDPTFARRVFVKCPTEEAARQRAREFEGLIAAGAPVPSPGAEGPRTMERLAASYVEEHLAGLSLRYREKHEYLLRRWILPRLGNRSISSWTPAESAAVIRATRQSGASDALVQDVGSALRGLVTHARRLQWLTAQSQDPMWMVRYAKTASVQGAASSYVPRSSLPTDEQCRALFEAMEAQGHRRWATAMRLTHRSGLRWGELIALQADDIAFEPARVVHVRRAIEQGVSGPPSTKAPKNGKVRTSIFPRSLADELRSLVDEVTAVAGPGGLLFPNASGTIIRRSNFQQTWIRAADAAGWPMTAPIQRSGDTARTARGGVGPDLRSGRLTTSGTSQRAGCCSISASTQRSWPTSLATRTRRSR